MSDVADIEARLRAAEERAARLEAACIVVCTDGERQCLLCGEWADPPKPIAHDEDCLMVGNTSALDAARAEAVRETLAKARKQVDVAWLLATDDGTFNEGAYLDGARAMAKSMGDMLAALDADGGSDG